MRYFSGLIQILTMKIFLILCFFLFTASISFSQIAVTGSFNASTPGLYYTLGVDNTWLHHRLGGGLNINQGYAAGAESLKYPLKPEAANEYFGLNLNYSYVFYPSSSEIEPFFFFDLNYQYCGFRDNYRLDFTTFYDTDPTSFNTFTETIGIGFTTDIYKNIYLIMKGGIGLSQENTFDHFEFDSSGFCYKTSGGVGFRFGDWQYTD